MHIIARTGAVPDAPVAYFIELPDFTTVTVNGRTLTNHGGRTDSGFYIGPLEGFNIIEFNNAPIFFWRDKVSAKYVSPWIRNPFSALSHREIRNREASEYYRDNITFVQARERHVWPRSRTPVPAFDIKSAGKTASTESTESTSVSPGVETVTSTEQNTINSPPKGISVRHESISGSELSSPPKVSPLPEESSVPRATPVLTERSPSRPTWTDEQTPSADREGSEQKLESAPQSPFAPCTYLRSTLEELVQQRDIENWLNEEVSEAFGEQISELDKLRLSDEDVFYSIEAVSHAISDLDPDNCPLIHLDYKVFRKSYFAETGVLLETAAPELTPGSVLFLPWRVPDVSEEYSVLALVEVAASVNEAQLFRIRIFDSAPWTLTRDQRLRLVDNISLLLKFLHQSHSVHPLQSGEITWVSHGRSQHDWQARYYTILHAWSVLLGLELNKNFQATEEFFQAASFVIRLAIGGFTDWKLILALLSCHRFVKQEDFPRQERRFPQAVSKQQYDQRMAQSQKKTSVSKDHSQRKGSFLIDYKFPQSERSYDTQLSSDEWTRGDRQLRAPLLQKSGQISSALSAAELRDLHGKRVSNTSTLDRLKANLDPEPCREFRKNLNDLLTDEDVSRLLRLIRKTPEQKGTITLATTEKGKWLQDDEVSLAIASVTSAITKIQGPEGGFSIMPELQRSMIAQSPKDNIVPIDKVIRFGKPMIVPINYDQHFVLLVIQLAEDLQPAFFVLDPMSWDYSHEGRKALHEIATAILTRSHWARNILLDGEMEIPKHTIWTTCAQQNVDWYCGHYVILFAWALSMGLELNADFSPDLSEESHFFNDVRDIIHLARIGYADWRLILAFFRCYKFVVDAKEVPDSSRFANTMRYIHETELDRDIETMRGMEIEHWLHEGFRDLRTRSRFTSFNFGAGRRHSDPFISDDWSEELRYREVNRLRKWGIFNPDRDENGILEDYRAALENPLRFSGKVFEKFKKDFNSRRREQGGAQFDEASVESIIEDFHAHPQPLSGLHEKLKRKKARKDAYKYTNESRRELLALKRLLTKRNIPACIRTPEKYGEYLGDDFVNLAIVSVLEAINGHKDFNNGYNNGGFAITTSTNVAIARESDLELDLLPALTRPRRCWLLPFTVDGEFSQRVAIFRDPGVIEHSEGEGHTFLVVIQEEPIPGRPPDETRFCVHILDSFPEYFDDIQQFLYFTLENTAERLQWSVHRNEDGPIKFTFLEEDPPFDTIPVARQVGSFACGYHTILNAWIIALGLTPDPAAKLNEGLYKRTYNLFLLATLGLLDWLTLVTFLFCEELTIEISLKDVPMNRRFSHTRLQKSEVDLAERIEISALADMVLGTISEAVVPYDHSTNKETWAEKAQEEVEEEFEEEFEEDYSDENGDGLWRQIGDDFDAVMMDVDDLEGTSDYALEETFTHHGDPLLFLDNFREV